MEEQIAFDAGLSLFRFRPFGTTRFTSNGGLIDWPHRTNVSDASRAKEAGASGSGV
jgi:hypothetical protein